MTELSSETIHASCVAIHGRAVLLAGPSGAGKSDLALRLIDRGATLVSDDYTHLVRRDGVLYANPPATIEGRIEVRGIGIVPMPHVGDIPVALLIDLATLVPRMPDRRVRRLAGVAIPTAVVAPHEASAPIKVELLLANVPG